MMSKQDYVLIAAVFKDQLEKHPDVSVSGRDRQRAVVDVIEAFANAAQQQNKLFNKAVFYGACGLRANEP